VAAGDLIAQTREELTALLADRLTKDGLEAELTSTIAAAAVAALADKEIVRPQAGTLALLTRRYAIRSDDLNVLDGFIKSFVPLAMGGFAVTGSAGVAALSFIIGAALQLLRSAWQRGARITDDEHRVLLILMSNITTPEQPGMTAEEIAGVVHRTTDWTVVHIQNILRALSAKVTRNQSTIALVTVDGAERWRPHT
jgi:hypothetical protein